VGRLLRVAALLGGLWGILAPAVHLAMFRGELAPPAFDALGVVRLLLDLPFLGALAAFTLAGVSSPTPPPLVVSSIVIGTGAGLALGAAWRMLRRRPS